MSRPRIDWNELLEGYNEMYGLHYNTLEEFIKGIYNKHRIEGAAKVLGVSPAAFQSKMVQFEIPREEKGHPHPTKLDKFKKLSDEEAFKRLARENIKTFIGETAKLINISNNHAQVLRSLRKRGYKYYDSQKSHRRKKG